MLRYAGKDFLQTELDELSLLVNYDGDDLVEFVNDRLHDKDTHGFNNNLVFMYLKFHACGLVAGDKIFGGFEFQGLTYRAKDLLDDIENTHQAQIKAIKDDKRFRLYVAVIGALFGSVFGFATSLITKLAGIT